MSQNDKEVLDTYPVMWYYIDSSRTQYKTSVTTQNISTQMKREQAVNSLPLLAASDKGVGLMSSANASISQTPVVEQAPVDFILKDGVYPYDDPEDKFVIIIDGEEVAWSSTYTQAWRSYHEMMRIETAHFTRCPEDRSILINLPGQTQVMVVGNV